MPAHDPVNRPPLILASGSPYRRELLSRICNNFSCHSPDIDESPLAGELPGDLALRLAEAKASKIALEQPAATVIGSDQVAALGQQTLGKPGNYANAVKQLGACSGLAVVFYTAVHVCNKSADFAASHVDITTVQFRTLSSAEIDAYVRADEPWDCAGSFRSEGLGVTLFESVETRDPTALIGLPMIWLAGSLRRAGIPIPSDP